MSEEKQLIQNVSTGEQFSIVDFSNLRPGQITDLPSRLFTDVTFLQQRNGISQRGREWDLESMRRTREELSRFGSIDGNSLTERQSKNINSISSQWVKNLTNPINRKEVVTHLQWLYAFCNARSSEIIFARSPEDAQNIARDMVGSNPYLHGQPNTHDELQVPSRSVEQRGRRDHEGRFVTKSDYARHFQAPPGVFLVELLKDHLRGIASVIPPPIEQSMTALSLRSKNHWCLKSKDHGALKR